MTSPSENELLRGYYQATNAPGVAPAAAIHQFGCPSFGHRAGSKICRCGHAERQRRIDAIKEALRPFFPATQGDTPPAA